MTELLIHYTTRRALPDIARNGLRERSYWALEGAVSRYYEEAVREEGDEPVALCLPLALVAGFAPMPDRPGLQEPLTHPLEMSEEEVWEAWEATDGSWEACLGLIQSMLCGAAIPAEILRAHNPLLQAEDPSIARAARPGP